MKISVDAKRCTGHARCYAVDQDLFTIDEHGYCNIGQDKPVGAAQLAIAQRGVDACPEGALDLLP